MYYMKKRLLAMFLAALLLATAVSCGDDEGNEMQPDDSAGSQNQQGDVVKPTPGPDDGSDKKPTGSETPEEKPNPNAGITLTSPDKVDLQINQIHQIVASFIAEYAQDSTALTYTSSDEAILTVDASGLVTAHKAGSASVSVANESGKYRRLITFTVTEDIVPPDDNNPTPDRTQYLTIFENSLFQGNLILVNAQNKALAESAGELLNIKQNTSSSHLRVGLFKYQITAEALQALSDMADAYYEALGTESGSAFKDFLVTDAHRSPAEQQEKIDRAEDDTPVGESDFQTGLSVYLKLYNSLTYNIGDANAAAETQWILQNCAKYGFILRYPEGKKNITGHNASAAHFRYVGIPHAAYITENGITLEEYVALLKGYSLQKPLKITVGDQKYSVYYVASQGESSTVPVPSFTTSVPYTVSGNNVDGFIITCTK